MRIYTQADIDSLENGTELFVSVSQDLNCILDGMVLKILTLSMFMIS